MIDYRNQLAVVTGGSNGNLGPIFTRTLKGIGMDVCCLDLPDYDVRNSDDIRRAVITAGVPAVLVNNAAIDNPPTGNGSYWGSWDEIMEVNLKGTKLCSQIIGRHMMLERGGGLIVNVCSIMGFVAADWHNYPDGFEKPGAYNVSKAAIMHLSKSMQGQFGQDGLRCVPIAFGPVDTGKFSEPFKGRMLERLPMGEFLTEEDVRETLLFALRCPHLAGAPVLVDAGYTCW